MKPIAALRIALISTAACVLAHPAFAQDASQPVAPGAVAGTPSTSASGASVATTTAPLAAKPTPAAQQQSTGSANTGDIVVTAQRREQRLQDVPVSVSVTTGATIARIGVRDLSDLSVRLPNVKITTAALTASLNIRGVGSGYNAGFEQSVATFVDGIYRGRSRATQAALFDVDRIEVLKGPQTTFFGANAIAGALNVSTRTPTNEFQYNAAALYSPSDGEYSLEAGTTVPLTDTLSLRVAGRYSGMNGYIRNTLLDNHGPHLRDLIGRATLAWDVNPDWQSTLRVDAVRQRDTGTYDAETVNCPPDAAYGAARGICLRYLNAAGAAADTKFNYRTAVADSYTDYDMIETGWTNRFSLGDYTITATTGYFNHDFDVKIQNAPLPLTGTSGRNALQPGTYPEKYNQFSQEVRLQSPADEPISYMLGGYFQRGDLDTKRYSTFYYATFGALAAPIYNADSPIARFGQLKQVDRTVSVFGSGSIKANDWLTLNVGARYSTVHKRASRFIQLGTAGNTPDGNSFVPGPTAAQAQLEAGLGIVPGDFGDKTRTDSKFMPSANLQFVLNPTTNAYVSYAKGFKAGGFGDSDQIIRFDPETVDAYEIGLKGTAIDRKLYYNIALFLSKYSNLQEASSIVQNNGTIIQSISNVARAKSQGVEFGASYRVNDFFSFNTDLAYLDSKYQDYNAGPCTILQSLAPGCIQDLSGKRRAYSPKYSGNAGFTVTVPLNSDYQIRLDPSLYFSSKFFQQFTADPLTQQKGYVKYDLRVAAGPSNQSWEIAILGKNLSDKKTGSFRQPLGTSPGSFYVIPERPLSVAFQFTIKG